MRRIIYTLTIFLCLAATALPVLADSGSVEVTGTIPFAISYVSYDNLTSSGVTIHWETNAPASSQVFYDTTSRAADPYAANYEDSTTLNSALETTHSENLTGLNASTPYYIRVQSTANISGTDYNVTSVEYTFTTSGSTPTTTTTTTTTDGGGDGGGGSGGGGGGAGDLTVTMTPVGLLPSLGITLNLRGQTSGLLELTTTDGMTSLKILAGTALTDRYGEPLTELISNKIANPLPAPKGYTILEAYDFGPSGARFTPTISIIMKFDTRIMPANGDPQKLKVAYWDSTKWVLIDTILDTEKGTITFQTYHFTYYALIYEGIVAVPTTTSPIMTTTTTISIQTPTPKPTITPTPLPKFTPPVPTTAPVTTPTTPAPAAFIVSDLEISPSPVKKGQTVTISVLLTNTGDTEDICRVTLKVNRLAVAMQDITLVGHESIAVTFTTKGEAPGKYDIDVDGLIGSFNVPGQISWTIILISFIMVLMVTTAIVWWIQKRS